RRHRSQLNLARNPALTTTEPSRDGHLRAGLPVVLLGSASGAIYGVLTLVAGIGSIAWLALLIVISRRYPVRALSMTAIGFVVGFAIALFGVVVATNLSCTPPSCYGPPLSEDLTWAAADLVIAAAFFGVARLGLFLAMRRA
ncbi:MAG: hypothetical protein M3003_14460, partial [Candidatus Dormibacteraeota bacterium]|nr:hypothetical protein [Candidatus Dormibacteraeota bacterium]